MSGEHFILFHERIESTYLRTQNGTNKITKRIVGIYRYEHNIIYTIYGLLNINNSKKYINFNPTSKVKT